MPNKISQFWQELKRRNVIRVITVYAGAAFVILELVDMSTEPFGLPSWTFTLASVLLSIGFIIAIILSWIYDVHPEGGMVKTEPAHEVKKEDIPKPSSGWKIASYISFVVIVALIILNIIPRNNRSEAEEILDKSIAVLPFIDDSPDKNNEHIINGIMEDLLINLQSIKELRVPGRTTTEQYRNNPKSIPEISNELNVAYLVEGSGQRYGNKIRLRVQLIEGKTDKHIWADSFDEVINGPEDFFRIQSQIAKSIAAKLQAVITPEEKQLIEKIQTTNLTAYDFYQRGRAEHEKHWLDGHKEALERAEDLYYQALEYDSTFALAYTGLAWVYWNKHELEEYLTENFLDSVLILTDIALSFDDQLAEGYIIKGQYFQSHNQKEQALNEYEKAIKFNPNEWLAYWGKGSLNYMDDNIKTIDNLNKAASLQRGSFLPLIYRRLCYAYLTAGFKETSYNYVEEALKLDNDSVEYYFALVRIEHGISDYENTIEFGERLGNIDSTFNDYYRTLSLIGYSHLVLGQVEESLECLKKSEKILKSLDRTMGLVLTWLGHAYRVKGFNEEAKHYLNEGIEEYHKILELGQFRQSREIDVYYNLAASYASLGDKDKSYEYLRRMNQFERMSLWVTGNIKDDPMFNSIRNEPEFQQIVKDIEAKYHAEHERVRQWLKENDML